MRQVCRQGPCSTAVLRKRIRKHSVERRKDCLFMPAPCHERQKRSGCGRCPHPQLRESYLHLRRLLGPICCQANQLRRSRGQCLYRQGYLVRQKHSRQHETVGEELRPVCSKNLVRHVDHPGSHWPCCKARSHLPSASSCSLEKVDRCARHEGSLR